MTLSSYYSVFVLFVTSEEQTAKNSPYQVKMGKETGATPSGLFSFSLAGFFNNYYDY